MEENTTMTPMLFVAIEFVDGTKIKYSFPAQTDSKAARQVKIEDFLKSRHLLVQVEGRLVIHPIENIRTMELSTGGGSLEELKLPPHTIRGATPMAC